MAKKIGRPSLQSIAMKKSWERRKAAQAAKAKTTKTTTPSPAPEKKRMKVRVISHQDGMKMDEYEIDTLGELFDILTGAYLGIVVSEVLIQSNSTWL